MMKRTLLYPASRGEALESLESPYAMIASMVSWSSIEGLAYTGSPLLFVGSCVTSLLIVLVCEKENMESLL